MDLRFLDDAGTRSAAAADPAAFVRHKGLMVIDEVQRVPDLMPAIKHAVDLGYSWGGRDSLINNEERCPDLR